MKRTSTPYTIVPVAKDWKYEIVFEREYEEALDRVVGSKRGFYFIDEDGKVTRVIYAIIGSTDDGHWMLRLDKRTIRYMKRARVAA